MSEVEQKDSKWPKLMTTEEVANYFRVSNMTVYRLVKSGQLKAIRVGKNYRFRAEDVLAAIGEVNNVDHQESKPE